MYNEFKVLPRNFKVTIIAVLYALCLCVGMTFYWADEYEKKGVKYDAQIESLESEIKAVRAKIDQIKVGN